ncbi:MAG: chorismate synthase [Firmicutes bacterium]|nr:chorismate synthase [Bacillota bacterium]
MSGTWGSNIKFSIFGESHGKAIGITIDGLKPGIGLDLDYIRREMDRRAPGKSDLSTQRQEGDSFEILSGLFNGRTTGTPLCAIIRNSDQRSGDYEKTKALMRPSHADYTGHVKYRAFNDYRGGGHFSGRLTAPLVFAGAVCRQILEAKGILIGSHIRSIGSIEDRGFSLTGIDQETLRSLREKSFPVLDDGAVEAMQKEILDAKEDRDSVGGVIEAAAVNLPAGIGEPFFDSLESTLAHILFSVPGVKGLEFGAGFAIAGMRGSEANDECHVEDGKLRMYTNNNGGILGGITNGMPLVFRVAVKPTPSIGRPQRTVNIDKMENETIEIAGRHDPCIVTRAVPVIEAVTAMALLDNID